MFRTIRVRAGSAACCPYNTPLLFANNTPYPLSFQSVAATEPFFRVLIRIGISPPPSDSGQSCTLALGRNQPMQHAIKCRITTRCRGRAEQQPHALHAWSPRAPERDVEPTLRIRLYKSVQARSIYSSKSLGRIVAAADRMNRDTTCRSVRPLRFSGDGEACTVRGSASLQASSTRGVVG